MNRKKSQNIQRKSQYLLRYQKANKLKQLGFTSSWNINDQKRQYNALEDPYANRYFRYQSVKIHIKQLKKSIGKVEKNDKQKKRIAKLIKQKLSDHLPAIKVAAQTYNISKEQMSKNYINKFQQSKMLVKDKSISELGVSHKRKIKSKNKKKLNSQNRTLNISVQPIQRQTQGHLQQEQKSETERQKSENINFNSEKQLIQIGSSKGDLKSQKGKKSEDRKQAQRKGYFKMQQQILHRKKHEDFIAFIAKKKQVLQNTTT